MTIVIKRIDHLGIAVPSLAEARAAFEALGLRVEAEHDVPSEKVKTPRVGAGGCRVAFIHPKAAAGVLLELKEARTT